MKDRERAFTQALIQYGEVMRRDIKYLMLLSNSCPKWQTSPHFLLVLSYTVQTHKQETLIPSFSQ